VLETGLVHSMPPAAQAVLARIGHHRPATRVPNRGGTSNRQIHFTGIFS
jgi:hypothetical protein